ncbi:MAG: low affinity iron permease family protein [Acidobacteriota bacterium]|nr:low affinity iron permease family protein [Acidobacteriota bacterium]
MNSFRKFAQKSAEVVGSPWSFIVGVLMILVWGAAGPYFHYSDTWQLVINTGSSIITFLMVFLIQNTQNRDAKVISMKLDELIRAIGDARTELVQMEKLTDQELDGIRTQFEMERDQAMKQIESIEQSKKARHKPV